MIRLVQVALVVLVSAALTAPGISSAQDAAPAITQVVSIDTKGKTDVILNEAANNAKIFARLGIKATRRYLQATLAGPNAGTFAVVIEYPSLAEMAAAQQKLQNDPEWQKYIQKIQDADMVIDARSTTRAASSRRMSTSVPESSRPSCSS